MRRTPWTLAILAALAVEMPLLGSGSMLPHTTRAERVQIEADCAAATTTSAEFSDCVTRRLKAKAKKRARATRAQPTPSANTTISSEKKEQIMKLLERTMGTPESKIREYFDGPFGKPTVDTVFLGNVGYQRLRYPIGIRFFFRNGVVAVAQLCCSDCLCKDDPLAAFR